MRSAFLSRQLRREVTRLGRIAQAANLPQEQSRSGWDFRCPRYRHGADKHHRRRGSLLAIELLDGVYNIEKVVILQLGIDRKRQHFFGGAF